jgi:hypothetical protein
MYIISPLLHLTSAAPGLQPGTQIKWIFNLQKPVPAFLK